MSLSTVLSRDTVTTRLIFNMMKRNKYEDYLKDALVGDLKWSAIIDNSLSTRGWLKCDGSSLSRTEYSALFAVISTTYGSADGTHFNLPNCVGRVLAATGTPTTPNSDGVNLVQGVSYGNTKHTLTVTEMPSHTHAGQTNETADNPESEGVMSGINTAQVSGSNPRKLSFTTDATGGGQAFDIQQPSIVIGSVFIYSGVYDPLEPTVDIDGLDDTEYGA